MHQLAQTKQSKHLGYFDGVDIPDYDKILNCMRCGMCLPVCPTYNIKRVEKSSPRGRVALIRAVADGKLELSQGVADEAFLCLDCRACETACPAGVRVGYLIEAARSQAEQHLFRPWWERAVRWFVYEFMFLRQWRLELFAWPMRLYQQLGIRKLVHQSGLLKLLPKRLRFMEELVPDGLETPLRLTIADEVPAVGEEKARVGFFLGCMMSILFSKTSRATVDVLTKSGCRVITPKAQRCCGAPLANEGYKDKIKDLARFNIDLFEKLDVDYIVSDCAACGCVLKEYEEILEDDPEYAERAKAFSNKSKDITQFLSEWPHFDSKKGSFKGRVCYDQPCHLQHAQGVCKEPHNIIREVRDLEYVQLPESDWCCGSAGTYNVTNYEMSMKILDRKMNNLEKINADILLTANPGCLLQLRWGTMDRNLDMKVMHVTELLSKSLENSKSSIEENEENPER